MKLTSKRQKEVFADFVDGKYFDEYNAYIPCGDDVNMCKKLEKMGFLKSIQKYAENDPWRTGEAFGYEIRHYYISPKHIPT